jgi:transcriptional regulator with XRE-family HTH domain
MSKKDSLQESRELASEAGMSYQEFDKQGAVADRGQMISYRILSEIEKICNDRIISRKELAVLVGVSPSYITQLFRGNRRVNMDFVAKIEHALDIQFEIKAVKKPEHKTFIEL